MDGLTEGRMVHYVMKGGCHRPAVIVRVWNDEGVCNLVVFPDGSNDHDNFPSGQPLPFAVRWVDNQGNIHDGQVAPLIYWATSVRYSEDKEPGTWHWTE